MVKSDAPASRLPPMLLRPERIPTTCVEHEVYDRLLALDGAQVLELGCGRAEQTRRIASTGRDRHIVAFELDPIQHGRNLEAGDLPNVEFRLGGAEAIAAPDASFDVVLLFKSLQHVPIGEMPQALREISRVLRPGGHAYVSEPLFAGACNEIVRLFRDESRVREAAFMAVRSAVATGLFELVEEVFFNVPVRYTDFAAFERDVIGVTRTSFQLTPAVQAAVRRRFEGHASADGASFANPLRVDLLRKPLAVS